MLLQSFQAVVENVIISAVKHTEPHCEAVSGLSFILLISPQDFGSLMVSYGDNDTLDASILISQSM